MNIYDKCVKVLTSREKFYINLGLERVSKILDLFSNPQDKIKVIHVAGTNGKGSTCAILSSILQEAGLKVGLFTSPHLVKYNERIKVNSFAIEDETFFDLLQEVDEKAKQNDIYLTEFELLTVVGFLYFERSYVDIAIVEVGLGGRLDATNVVKSPLVSVITSISLDHTDRLGDTIEKIAYEKAGILKKNVPCCVCENNGGLAVIQQVAKKLNSRLITTKIIVKNKILNNKNYVYFDSNEFEFNLNGKYQNENLSLVLCVIGQLKNMGFDVSNSAIVAGLKKVVHSGRFEFIKKMNLLVDGAHNPNGAVGLRTALESFFADSAFSFIYSSINTKDYKTFLSIILKEKDEISFLKFNHTNAVDASELTKYLDNKNIRVIEKNELIEFIQKNKSNNKITVLTGSLYAIGEVYPLLLNFIENSPHG